MATHSCLFEHENAILSCEDAIREMCKEFDDECVYMGTGGTPYPENVWIWRGLHNRAFILQEKLRFFLDKTRNLR